MLIRSNSLHDYPRSPRMETYQVLYSNQAYSYPTQPKISKAGKCQSRLAEAESSEIWEAWALWSVLGKQRVSEYTHRHIAGRKRVPFHFFPDCKPSRSVFMVNLLTGLCFASSIHALWGMQPQVVIWIPPSARCAEAYS